MARYVLSFSALILVVSLYLATNQVVGQDESTTSMCDDGMEVGDIKTFPNCYRCKCEEEGMSCGGCPVSDPIFVPEGCTLKRRSGNYPRCCKKKIVCP